MKTLNPSANPVLSSSSAERLSGIVERITFHNETNGWTVLKLAPFDEPNKQVSVLVHQAKIFAGASIEFWGSWSHHPKHGRQFRASSLIEKKPASAAALEKYLGSGLIKGVGPKIAQRIVRHFREQTLFIFESDIEALMKVPGIAKRKLLAIKTSWEEHRSIRDVMIFLQGYGISSLFATKIFKTYGNQAIEVVSRNPYRLAHDIYGIGFFSADRIALAMGFDRQGEARIEAGIKHVLAASREEGHCFLLESQILEKTQQILKEEVHPDLQRKVLRLLHETQQIKSRTTLAASGQLETCYYSKTLFYDELTVARLLASRLRKSCPVDENRIRNWVERYCVQHEIQLSIEQKDAVCGIPRHAFSILTGGPGVGKTTCTRVLVGLLKAMQKKVLLAAPTGRAAQRMSELMDHEAKTLHRLLEWAPHLNSFKKNSQDPLDADFLIVDESSMLDIQLASSLLQAVPPRCQLLFIGDPDQLPSVGAGNVLFDLIKTAPVPRYRLTQVFRQAQASSIVRFAHEINTGVLPKVISPLQQHQAFREGHDCLFVDADEASQEQIRFVQRAKRALEAVEKNYQEHLLQSGDELLGRVFKGSKGIEVDELYRPPALGESEVQKPVLYIPEKFQHVDLLKLAQASKGPEQIRELLRFVHPWSSLHFGLTAVETLVRLYQKSIPEWMGAPTEIQVLSPQVRGSLGTANLNSVLQNACNPESERKKQLRIGERIFRVGDRVIQNRNNYQLGVFNGDIGSVSDVNFEQMSVRVRFSGSSSENRELDYSKEDLTELALAYAITIHKSQGSEFPVVIIPVMGQHFNMLFRNLLYTALTRAKKLAIFLGSRRAFAMAIDRIDNRQRQTALSEELSQQLRT